MSIDVSPLKLFNTLELTRISMEDTINSKRNSSIKQVSLKKSRSSQTPVLTAPKVLFKIMIPLVAGFINLL